MSETNKTLHDLLNAARTEPTQEFVSANDAQRLVANSIVRDVPSSWQRVSTRLLSSPLRLSITAMTSAAVITLATLGVRSLLTTSAPTITQPPQLAQAQHQQPHYKVVVVDSNSNRSRTPSSGTAEAPALPELPAIPSISAVPALPALPSVVPVDVTPEQAAALGIKLEENGEIRFYSQTEPHGMVNSYAFPLKGGVRLSMQDKPQEDELNGLKIYSFEPRLVTSPNGAKRLFTFRSDTTFESQQPNGKSHYRMSTRMIITPDDSSHTEMSQALNEEKVIIINGDTMHSVDPKLHKDLQFTINGDHPLPGFHAYHSDSGTHKLMLKKNVFVLRDSAKLSQSITDSSMKMVYQMIHAGDANLKTSQFDSVLKEARHTIVNMLSTPDGTMISYAQPLDMNKLIPLRIVNHKNPQHPNELIFWYEATPEITNLLPAQKQSGTVRMAQNFSVSVYPNPTSGLAQIAYTMKDGAHHADFVIRNLLGQKVMVAGSTDGASGNVSLDLSKLDAGLYLLVTTTDDGEQSVERIVVNK